MKKLTFFPLGNADCCLIDLSGGQKLLFDFADTHDPSDPDDKRIDLTTELRQDLDASQKVCYEVVAFSHLDKDHYAGASEFFHLEHAKKYQGDGRIRIDELWVPAAAIVETNLDEDEAKILQREARFRFKEGKGIRVFSRPEALKDWLASQGLTVAERQNVITDAGRLVPGFTADIDGIEFFAHSPFAKRLEDGTVVDRNRDSIVLHATFQNSITQTKFILGSDVDHEALSEIVSITRSKGNDSRLEWDVFKLPHHCSYLSIGPDKGTNKTDPAPEVEWLYEVQGQNGGIAVSTSKPIPSQDEVQPPHRQAAAYYRDVVQVLGGEFVVTMEHPSERKPEKLEIEICDAGAKTLRRLTAPAVIATSSQPPRAGMPRWHN